jgi:hypothetical protein
MSEQFDLFGAEELKLEGISRVSANNAEWIEFGLFLADKYLPYGRDVMGEEFKTLPGIGTPTRSECWGALVRMAIIRHIIKPTGRYAKAKSRSNHAHRYAVYVRLGPPA